MDFNFDKYEDIERLLSDNNDEESIRTAISRAYYCIYHKARIILGIPKDRYISHELIINQIRDSLIINNGQKLSLQIDKLKQDRVFADYYRILPRPIVFNKNYLVSFWKRYEIIIDLLQQAN